MPPSPQNTQNDPLATPPMPQPAPSVLPVAPPASAVPVPIPMPVTLAAPTIADLASQIPTTYAPAPPTQSSPAMQSPPAAGPPSALQAALEQQLAAPEPDPMAGFITPSPAPLLPTGAAPTIADLASVQPPAGVANPPLTPAPSAPPIASSSPVLPIPVPETNPAAVVTTPPAGPSIESPTLAPTAPIPMATPVPTAPITAADLPTPIPVPMPPMPPNPLEVDDFTPAFSGPPAAALDPAVPNSFPVPPPPPPGQQVAPPKTPVEPDLPPSVNNFSDPTPPMLATVPASSSGRMSDPRLQSMLDQPDIDAPTDGMSGLDAMGQPLDMGLDPLTDPDILSAAASTSSSGGGSKKGILVGIVFGVGVLLIGFVVLALLLGQQTKTPVPADDLTPRDATSDSSGTSTTGDGTSDSASTDPSGTGGSAAGTSGSSANTTSGYVPISKACYSFALPKDNTVTKDTVCKIDATFGSLATNTITVIPNTDSWTSLDAALAVAKSSYKLVSPVSKKIKLGGFDAYEITHTVGGSQKAVKIIVGSNGKSYKSGGVPVTGFEINMPAFDTTTQSAVAELERTWVWK